MGGRFSCLDLCRSLRVDETSRQGSIRKTCCFNRHLFMGKSIGTVSQSKPGQQARGLRSSQSR